MCCFDVWTGLNFKLQLVDPSVRVDREKETYRRQKQLVWYSSTALVIWHPTNVFVAPAVAPTAAATQLRSAVKHYLLVFFFLFSSMRLFIVATPLTDKILWLLNKRLRGEITKERRLSPHKKNNKIFSKFRVYLFEPNKSGCWCTEVSSWWHFLFSRVPNEKENSNIWSPLAPSHDDHINIKTSQGKGEWRNREKECTRTSKLEKKKDVPKYYPHT